MNCIHCGQEMSHHRYSYYNRGANQCEIEIVECENCQIEEPAQLSVLREAGEKMAERLRENRSASVIATSTIQKVLLFSQKDAAALEEWEAANK